ncbi:hypothetical protein GGX14DRAFT_587239 [Mycena pura]|uniref:Uncharacterized protein n=1 Tax=Mycena pura TaxID=153505 RepID=A0AAD6USX2_9AGAR|nr:hypothetical protein GGX14DRAFT_587239 [Mycena pura]
MAAFYPPGLPPDMPPIWAKPTMLTTKLQIPRPETDDTEAPPPVPADLRGQECLYGYVVTDQLLKTYYATHPAAGPPSEYLFDSYKRKTIYDVAKHLGFDFDTHIESYPYSGKEDIVWFSYTKDGMVQITEVPTALRLECFTKELGITKKVQWLGSMSFPDPEATSSLHRLCASSPRRTSVLAVFLGCGWGLGDEEGRGNVPAVARTLPAAAKASSSATTAAMKPFYLLSFLAAALVASAQGTNSNSSDIASASANSVSVPDTNPPSASVVPSTPATPDNGPPSSSPPPPPSTPSAPPQPSQPASTPTPTSTPPPTSVAVSPSVSTNADGDISTVQVTSTITPPASSASPSSSPSPAPDNSTSSSSSIGKGGIIGLAVAGGVAVLFLIAFFVWKFTSKRKGGFDDTEDIKWPELNTHSGEGDTHPVPVHNTGRSGFDTSGDLSRVPSAANTFGAASSVDLHGDDPYAVPPLPHLNPNQPYRDDPNAMSPGGYDPYRGPVPQTINEANGPPPPEWGQTEAIPMTQMSGRMSPGPQAAYAGAGRTPSPGPQMAYNGRASPGPQQAYGRASPAPQAAAAYGRASPGPVAAYGRASPGPQPAYGGRMSPGPQQAYGGGI